MAIIYLPPQRQPRHTSLYLCAPTSPVYRSQRRARPLSEPTMTNYPIHLNVPPAYVHPVPKHAVSGGRRGQELRRSSRLLAGPSRNPIHPPRSSPQTTFHPTSSDSGSEPFRSVPREALWAFQDMSTSSRGCRGRYPAWVPKDRTRPSSHPNSSHLYGRPVFTVPPRRPFGPRNPRRPHNSTPKSPGAQASRHVDHSPGPLLPKTEPETSTLELCPVKRRSLGGKLFGLLGNICVPSRKRLTKAPPGTASPSGLLSRSMSLTYQSALVDPWIDAEKIDIGDGTKL